MTKEDREAIGISSLVLGVLSALIAGAFGANWFAIAAWFVGVTFFCLVGLQVVARKYL